MFCLMMGGVLLECRVRSQRTGSDDLFVLHVGKYADRFRACDFLGVAEEVVVDVTIVAVTDEFAMDEIFFEPEFEFTVV